MTDQSILTMVHEREWKRVPLARLRDAVRRGLVRSLETGTIELTARGYLTLTLLGAP